MSFVTIINSTSAILVIVFATHTSVGATTIAPLTTAPSATSYPIAFSTILQINASLTACTATIQLPASIHSFTIAFQRSCLPLHF